MAETLTIRTASSTEIVKIAVPGPQGPKGDKGDPGDVAGLPLSTLGDTLYRGASENQRLPIGTSGQILKVSAGGIPEWGAAPATGVTSVALASSDLTITGSPITSSGTITANVTVNGLTLNKLETINTAHFLGRHGSGAGDVQPVSASQARTILNVADGAEVNVQSNWTEADSDSDAFIQNKPATFAPSAHAASHAASGSDPLAPSDIGAQSLFSRETPTITANTTLTAARAKIYDFQAFSGTPYEVTLPTTGNQTGDILVARAGFVQSSSYLTFKRLDGSTMGQLGLVVGRTYRWVNVNGTGNGWVADDVAVRQLNLADPERFTGVLPAGNLPTGTGSTEVAAGNHTHGNLTNDGKVGSTAGLPVVTTTAGAVTTLALGTANQVLRVNSGATGVEFADPAASGVTGAAASASDVLGVSGANITGVDANADRLVFWDDSAGKLTHLTVGSGLSISDTTISATATGTIGGSTSTDNAIVRGDSTSNTVQDSAFIIADNATASPNNTVNHASIQATGGTTNVSVSIVPKGSGALSLHVPDATATGGNARGANAVDLQTVRDTAAKVASGAQSAIIGGRDNTASGTGGVIAAGYSCTVSQSYAFIGGGFGQSVSGQYSGVLGGRDASISGQQSAAVGANAPTVSGENAVVCGGFQNQATANNAFAIGRGSLANRFSLMAHGNIPFAAVGDSQRIRAVLRCKTTTNAAVEMALDGSTTYLTIPSGKVIFCNIKVVGVKSDGSVVATYERQYAAKNVAGTSSEVFAPVTIGTDNASSTSLEVATVDAGDYIRVRPTGIASEVWRWVASVDAVEVAYGT